MSGRGVRRGASRPAPHPRRARALHPRRVRAGAGTCAPGPGISETECNERDNYSSCFVGRAPYFRNQPKPSHGDSASASRGAQRAERNSTTDSAGPGSGLHLGIRGTEVRAERRREAGAGRTGVRVGGGAESVARHDGDREVAVATGAHWCLALMQHTDGHGMGTRPYYTREQAARGRRYAYASHSCATACSRSSASRRHHETAL